MIPAPFLQTYLPLLLPFLHPPHIYCDDTLQGTSIVNSIVIEEEEQDTSLITQLLSPFHFYFMTPQAQLIITNNQPNHLTNNHQATIQTPEHNDSKYYRVNAARQAQNRDLQCEPHIKLTVLKPLAESRNHQPIIITKDGFIDTFYLRLLNSIRNTDHQHITIGRQKPVNSVSGDIIVPNDLSFHDKGMNSIHCKLLSNECFSNYFNLKPDFFTLLCMTDRRSGHPQSILPTNILKKVFEFLRPIPSLQIVDMGTRVGTYLRVRRDEAHEMQVENNYMVGVDTHFHVLAMSGMPTQHTNKDYLYNCLARDVNKGVEIHGLSAAEWGEFHAFLFAKQRKSRKHYKLVNCDRPFLKAEFCSHNRSSLHLFIGSCDGTDNTFKIGRQEDCDVVIPLNVVSRRQSTVRTQHIYIRWTLTDGEDGRESANGTWESVQDYVQQKMTYKNESQPKELKNECEFKISDTHLKIEFVNFQTNKKRKLNCENYLPF